MQDLFKKIADFKKWASQIPAEKRIGEWECNYDGDQWSILVRLFEEFISHSDFNLWETSTIEQILYIIARDNETEYLSSCIAKQDELLLFLAEKALEIGEPDAKWQLAVKLQGNTNSAKASALLETYVEDEDEYVNRRALMALASLHSDKAEYYCQIAWDRTEYGEMQEYQRIAVLHTLYSIKSSLLEKYITKAKQDGRKGLLKNALEIESKRGQ